ncbi:MAG: ZIP family metal transporter, partial [Deltaproteobacteria bacterium]
MSGHFPLGLGLVEGFAGLSPVFQALVATLFTWGLTGLGALAVFLRKEPSRRFLDAMLGFAAGVMIAASFFSLLLPSVEMSGSWVPAVVGFLLGGVFLRAIDKVVPHLHLGFPPEEA